MSFCYLIEHLTTSNQVESLFAPQSLSITYVKYHTYFQEKRVTCDGSAAVMLRQQSVQTNGTVHCAISIAPNCLIDSHQSEVIQDHFGHRRTETQVEKLHEFR